MTVFYSLSPIPPVFQKPLDEQILLTPENFSHSLHPYGFFARPVFLVFSFDHFSPLLDAVKDVIASLFLTSSALISSFVD